MTGKAYRLKHPACKYCIYAEWLDTYFPGYYCRIKKERVDGDRLMFSECKCYYPQTEDIQKYEDIRNNKR